MINYKLATNPLLILPLGALFAVIYFLAGYYTIKLFKLKIFEEDSKEQSREINDEAQAFIDALGGKENITNTDACITRLRMSVHDSSLLKDEDFTSLGAKGVIRPDKKSIQVILGTKADSIAEAIKNSLR